MTRDLDRRIRSLEVEQEAGDGEAPEQNLQERPGCDLSGFPGETFGEKIDAVTRVVRGEAEVSPEAMNAGRCWLATVQRLMNEY